MAHEWQAAWAEWRSRVPAPDEPPDDDVDWDWAEDHLRVRLPADYKTYIDTYGVGYVNRLFLVLHPTTDMAAGNLEDVADGQSSVEGLSTLLTPPPLVWPGLGSDRLMACAVTSNEDVAYWYTRGDDPDAWPLVFRDRDGRAWRTYDMSLLEFLLGVFDGRLEPRLAEAGYAGDELVFDPDPFSS
ncbi:MAG TPA: hypothetical protein VGN37_20915 [Actinocatenispora sp.]